MRGRGGGEGEGAKEDYRYMPENFDKFASVESRAEKDAGVFYCLQNNRDSIERVE